MNLKIKDMLSATLILSALACMRLMRQRRPGQGAFPGTNPPQAGVDRTTDCKNISESGSYSVFYQPPVGWVGDPMPYFNEDDRTFYCFYLQDWRDGRESETRHLLHQTVNYGSFNGFNEAVPAGTIYEQDNFPGTGSFVKKDGLYYCFYTGHNGRLDPAEKVAAGNLARPCYMDQGRLLYRGSSPASTLTISATRTSTMTRTATLM